MKIDIDCEESSGSYSGTGSTSIVYSDSSSVIGKDIGHVSLPEGTRLDGSLDDFMIWDRALSYSEVLNLCSQTPCTDTITVYDTIIHNVYDTITVVVNQVDTSFITVIDTNYVTVNNYVDVYDSLIVDLTGVVTAIDAPFNKTLQVKVYPNPASELLFLEVLDAQVTSAYSFELINVTGSIVAEGLLNKNSTSIDISSFSGGTYYLKFYDEQSKMVNQAPVVVRK